MNSVTLHSLGITDTYGSLTTLYYAHYFSLS